MRGTIKVRAYLCAGQPEAAGAYPLNLLLKALSVECGLFSKETDNAKF